MNGYLTMDGNVPFYMSTHKDGSASIWPLGPEWVLDMPMDDAWFYADGSETTFGPKDIPYAGMWEDASDYGLISPDELWSDRYTYNIPLEKPSGQRMTSYYNSLNISMSSVSGYDQSRGVSVRYMDWGAWQPTPLSPFEAPEQQLLLAPGRTTLKVNIEYAKTIATSVAL